MQNESLVESLLQHDWKILFSALIRSNSLTPKMSEDLVDYLISIGKRKKAVRFIKFLRKNNCLSKGLCYRHLNCLLVLNNTNNILFLLEKYSKKFILSSGYCERVKSYLGSGNLWEPSADFIRLAQKLLWLEFKNYLDFGGQSCLQGLVGHTFSDIIIVSNNCAIRFSSEECRRLRSMKKPLFVYLNIGNPALSKMRKLFYSDNSYELLLGNPSFLVEDSSKLIFRPYRLSNFIGCFVLARRRMLLSWHSTLQHEMVAANQGINFFHFEPLIILQSIYPLSTFRDVGQHQSLKQRIPTVGCLALMFAYALSTFTESYSEQSFSTKNCNVWTAGFSMSPSYLFEACAGIEMHDFVFERVVQQHLIDRGHVRSLGQSNPLVSERSAWQHLLDQGHAIPARRSAFDRATAWEN